jgi:hypothetical protein
MLGSDTGATPSTEEELPVIIGQQINQAENLRLLLSPSSSFSDCWERVGGCQVRVARILSSDRELDGPNIELTHIGVEMLQFSLLGALVFVALAAALKDIPERARGGSAYGPSFLKAAAKAKTWQAPVDHFSKDNASFAQRYYVDDQFWNGDGPVFFEIGGEGTLAGPPGGYVAQLGAQYKALLISLEHRFYGESIPNDSHATENLKYLTVEQALADLNAFTAFYTESNGLKPANKWFGFGGSYPGGLASWYRIAYPKATVGTLSSSGVVNPIINFDGFDKQVSAAIGNECGARLKEISVAFEETVIARAEFHHARSLFNCESDMSERDFLYMIADSWSMADQYGGKSKLCDAILAPENPSQEVLMKTFADFSNMYWGAEFCSQGFYNTAALSDPERWDGNSRAWRWQTCYQVAWFNTAPTEGSIRSARVNLEYHLQQCAQVFGMKMIPATKALNDKFGGPAPIAHNVFYSDFSDDPWQRASVDYPPSTDQPYHLTTCDDCGHCLDLHDPTPEDPQALKDGRAEFEKYLAKWLS